MCNGVSGEPAHVQWREPQLYRTDHTLVPYAKKYLDVAFSRAGISTMTDEHGDIALTHLPMLPHELDALFNLIALEEQQDQPRHMAGPSTREAEISGCGVFPCGHFNGDGRTWRHCPNAPSDAAP